MVFARRAGGPGADLRVLASQVHPVFMLPPLAASLFGASLTGRFDVALAVLHVTAVFFALYTAHVKDGYVDFHVRDEDDDHPLTARGCRLALLGASVAFFACLAVVWVLVGPVAAALTLPGWVIGYNHAPTLDVHPVTATAGYPSGIGFALLGGYYLQAGQLSGTVLALAAVFVVVLSGIKIVDDAQDYEYDRSIRKRTAAVVVGPRRAIQAAYALMAVGMVAVVSLALAGRGVLPGAGGVPPGAAGAPPVFLGVALVARRAGPELATKLLIRGSYLFLAVLVGAVWFRPLA